jgi:Glycosyltransferases involved in cell wall biogenesis
MNGKLLTILIPTFNRKDSLVINLKMLIKYIEELNCYEDVEIIVSDNCSYDGTYTVVEEFFSNGKVHGSLYRQQKNIGLEKNALFCLSKSETKYSMFLGDDDYIDIKYFNKVLGYLKSDKSISCILMNSYTVDNYFNKLAPLRFEAKEDQVYLNFTNNLDLMFIATQLSGVVIKTEGTLSSYLEKGGCNIYPFVYFAAFNIKRGKTIHITDAPVRITVTNNKDWTYGDDGLITEVIQNIAMISETEKEKFRLEKIFIKRNKWRYIKYWKRPFPFLRIIFTSERYSTKLSLYITWNLFTAGFSETLKIIIRYIFKIFGYQINHSRISKI